MPVSLTLAIRARARVPPLGQEVIDRVVALTATEPPHEATHWTAAAMAKAVGISLSTTFVVGLRVDGIAAPMVLAGPMNRDFFQAYVTRCSFPSFRPATFP